MSMSHQKTFNNGPFWCITSLIFGLSGPMEGRRQERLHLQRLSCNSLEARPATFRVVMKMEGSIVMRACIAKYL